MEEKVMTQQSARISWIDWAKVFLIYFMVVGHFHPPLIQSQFFYVFHMPAFFIISGYLYHPHDWRRTVVSLMTPVVVFSVFNLGFQFLETVLKGGDFDTSNIVERTLWPFLGGVPKAGMDYMILFMGAWFPIVLMIIRLVVGDIKTLSFVYRYKVSIFFVSVAFMITLPFWADMEGTICQLKPFLFFPSLPFFLLGTMLHDINREKAHKWLNRLVPLFFVCYLVMALWNGRVGILNLHFGHNYFFFFIGAVSGSFVLFWVCSHLRDNLFVRTISVGTMLILGLHMDFYDVLFPILNRVGFYAIFPDWAVIWIAAALTLVLSYLPIRWCMRHMPILLGKISTFNSKGNH